MRKLSLIIVVILNSIFSLQAFASEDKVAADIVWADADNLGYQNFKGSDAKRFIKKHFISKWPNDFKMMKDCRDKQIMGFLELSLFLFEALKSGDEAYQDAFSMCVSKHHRSQIDYESSKFMDIDFVKAAKCQKEQIKAIESGIWD